VKASRFAFWACPSAEGVTGQWYRRVNFGYVPNLGFMGFLLYQPIISTLLV